MKVMVEKEALQYVVDLSAPTIIERDGLEYSDRPLTRIPDPKPNTICTTTLQSIVDFINMGVDRDCPLPVGRVIVHVHSPRDVSVLSECTKDGSRWERINAGAVVPELPFGNFLDLERFNITMQSMFVDTEDKAKVLGIVCNVSDSAVQDHADDGVTQTITIRAGVLRVGSAEVPNPVLLAPYRTFPDIAQPVSPFVLRMQPGARDGMLPTAALFEADGTAWRLEAMESIKAYFAANLDQEALESGNIVIMA